MRPADVLARLIALMAIAVAVRREIRKLGRFHYTRHVEGLPDVPLRERLRAAVRVIEGHSLLYRARFSDGALVFVSGHPAAIMHSSIEQRFVSSDPFGDRRPGGAR